MDTLFKADIFFFITSFVVIVLGVIVAIILVYLVRILRDLKAISQVLRTEIEQLVADVHHFRGKVRERAGDWSDTVKGLVKMFQGKKGRRK